MKADFYYNHELFKDILFAIIDNEAIPNRFVKDGRAMLLYCDEKLVGINFFNISEIIKIRSSGKIFLPNEAFIASLNSSLSKVNLELKEESGFKVVSFVRKINDITVEVKNEDETFLVLNKDKVNCSSKLLIALDGTRLEDGTLIETENQTKGIVINPNIFNCSEEDISSLKEGTDFFSFR